VLTGSREAEMVVCSRRAKGERVSTGPLRRGGDCLARSWLARCVMGMGGCRRIRHRGRSCSRPPGGRRKLDAE